MALDFYQTLMLAQTKSRDRKYLPWASKDISWFEAIVEQTNVELGLVAGVSKYSASASGVTANATVGPTTLFAVTGTNSRSSVFKLAMYAEVTDASDDGDLDFKINWTWNGGAEQDMLTISLASLGAQFSHTYGEFAADIGTNVTLEYTTKNKTNATTASFKMVSSFSQVI